MRASHHTPLRRQAFEKLASLSTQHTTDPRKPTDLHRICSLYRSPPVANGASSKDAHASQMFVSKIPMSVRELEVLTALCRAAPWVTVTEQAERLLHQIVPYLAEAHTQTFRPSPSLRDFQPSPWEVLLRDLTTAVLVLGTNHPSLRAESLSCITKAVDTFCSAAEKIAWTHKLDDQEIAKAMDIQAAPSIVPFTVSLLGFLGALAGYPRFWTLEERIDTIHKLRRLLSEQFMTVLEGTLSSVRNEHGHFKALKEWRRLLKLYASAGRPLGAMLLQQEFMRFVASSTVLLVQTPSPATSDNILDLLLQFPSATAVRKEDMDDNVLEALSDLIADEMALLEADADYLQLSSAWQQRLAFSVKANSLKSYLCCCLTNEDIADSDVLMNWLEAVLSDPVQFGDDNLAQVTFKCMAILAKISQPLASQLGRTLPRFIVQGRMTTVIAATAADCLASILMLLSQDTVISTLYSLGNVLSSAGNASRTNLALSSDPNAVNQNGSLSYSQPATGSSISLITSDAEETAAVYGAVVNVVVQIAIKCQDEKIVALAISMLAQKIGRSTSAVDAKIIAGSAALGLHGAAADFRLLVRLYSKLGNDALLTGNGTILDAVMEARLLLARSIGKKSPLYELYLVHLLDALVSTGDSFTGESRTASANVKAGAEEIAQLLHPLAVLVSMDPETKDDFEDPATVSALSRDAWFNLVVHDFTLNSSLGRKHLRDLQILACYSPSLIDTDRANSQESGLDLNTVLRRGMGPQHALQQKALLIRAIPASEVDIKGLDYAELTFLNAAYMIAVLRARSGDCTRTMEYFLDRKFKNGPLSNCLVAIAIHAVDVYLATTQTGRNSNFAAPELAQQLVRFLEGCCHRIDKVQHVATSSADRIINLVPSALCQRPSLFALLELLTLMWTSCLEAETDEYDWKPSATSPKCGVSIQLSDDLAFKQITLNNFHKRCRAWVSKIVDIAPLDAKGLLQTYLSDYQDDGAYGRISLGRSFALEMGSLVPLTEQRLAAIEYARNFNINTASDFVAQYTTRQQYRAIDASPFQDEQWVHVDRRTLNITYGDEHERNVRETVSQLREIESRLAHHHHIPLPEVKTALRTAATLLCRAGSDHSALVHYLVSIPFAAFSKPSIKLGISLWVGVIKENSMLEPRILAEIATNWESAVRQKRGIFSSSLQHLDPFYVREEFAPTDRAAIVKRQQIVNDLIAPHFRLVQFLSSHLNANRLCSPQLERIFFRLARVTLTAMKHSAGQPLAREVHFHLVLLALRILMYGTGSNDTAKWGLKDQILSAGLSWFSLPPRWSYGSNRIQLKAELQLIQEVTAALRSAASIGAKSTSSLQSLQPKQDLLLHLLSNESSRLSVWLSPLSHEGSSVLHLGIAAKGATEVALSPLLKVAWAESASLATQLVTRFQSQRLHSEVRWLLLNFPERALDEPEALHVLLGSSLPKDVSFQLKYLLYWAAVNPITAVTYFLPAYGNHPFIIQYAMRALESHSVDVTFFYVPQIVQTLRYDVLGYVERYIIETAKFSQLFAHQIIWNMKANAFKDEDSEIPDPVKPTLDKVTDSLLSSFSTDDKDFYEREFSFFNEVTSISGKLRPFIKRPKPEKKQKIEEELRLIKVDVGVYLPSNPDGVVVGIDRKSGKPLQSHAKAPFMATFRIRKEKQGGMEAEDEDLDKVAQGKQEATQAATYEVWQSAIFKVGDDCRQDVLALQMIAAFRGIFNNVGLDVYVFPYRVTATAPGCGVIDVLPNSISRDMLGREAVNGLYEYFVSKYGTEDSLRFQAARNNFIKSMAAYSVISYLLQFKDRHNGNIMVDDAGHILHIDFGFCFDIAPGGVRFERAPFKLTSEMVAVMGGSTESQGYRRFEELCVKAFLASRQYAEKLSHLVVVMLDSGLPCFKPETVQHFKERFVLDRTEREAAEFMRMLVHRSERSYSTKGYDQFQLLTNGIPY